MKGSLKKQILIGIASTAGLLLLAALGWFLYFKLQFSVYQDDQYKFSIKYPKAWKVVIHPYKNVAVVFLRPKDTALDTFQEDFNVTVQAVPNDILTLDAFNATVKRQLTGVFKTDKIVEDKPIRFGWREGHMIIWEEPDPDRIKFVNAWLIRGDQAYILTFMGDMNKYSQDSFVVQEMIHSLQLQENL